MPIHLFHGDNPGESRRQLNLLLDPLKSRGLSVRYLDGAKLTRPSLESALVSVNLFEDETLVIENLLSRVRSQEKLKLLNLISSYQGPKILALWEAKEVTKSNLVPFKSARLTLSKTPAVIFKLLDALVPGNYPAVHALLVETAKHSDPAFIFIMVHRHVGNLIIAKSGDVKTLSPFVRSRLVSQAAKWTSAALVAFHHRLFQIDLKIKTGSTKLDYYSSLDIALAALLD